MKTCPRCSVAHNKPGKFCSRPCANSRVFTEESKKKRAETYSVWYNSLSTAEKAEFNSKKHTNEIAAKRRKTIEQRLQNTPWDNLCHRQRKRIVVQEQDNSCLHCKLTEWLGIPIKLELDHMDGNNQNNARSNLRALCPNCHSQTPTWRKGWKNYSSTQRDH